jgi:hypothetical protein
MRRSTNSPFVSLADRQALVSRTGSTAAASMPSFAGAIHFGQLCDFGFVTNGRPGAVLESCVPGLGRSSAPSKTSPWSFSGGVPHQGSFVLAVAGTTCSYSHGARCPVKKGPKRGSKLS